MCEACASLPRRVEGAGVWCGGTCCQVLCGDVQSATVSHSFPGLVGREWAGEMRLGYGCSGW